MRQPVTAVGAPCMLVVMKRVLLPTRAPRIALTRTPAWPVLDELFMRGLIRNIVSASLAGSVALASGCASDEPQEDLTGFTETSCRDGGFDILSGLEPSEPFDAIAWRAWKGDNPTSLRDRALPYGEPCDGAADEDACNAAWATAIHAMPDDAPSCNGTQSECHSYLVVASNGSPQPVISRAQLIELLGAIDTPDEASVLAMFANYDLECANLVASSVRSVDDGFEVNATRIVNVCPVQTDRYRLHIARDGALLVLSQRVHSTENACIGRKPEGLMSCAPVRGDSELGDFLARCAHLEAASVDAFRILASELRAHGAPAELIALAERSAQDEMRHAERVGELARAHGGDVIAPRVQPSALRSLEAIALENAVEGCVRETYGAAVGAYQARAANDAGIAAVMDEVARDEAAHASFAWQLAAWLDAQLAPAARARVTLARRQAVLALQHELSAPASEALHTQAGWPRPRAAHALFDGLAHTLWS